MSEQPPILEATPPTDEQRRLIALFAEIESTQIDFLDQAGKSIVERIAALLAVLFAVTAFGSNFPPPYLKGNPSAKYLALVTLACYLGAMFMGMRVVLPRSYKLYRHNLSEMKHELDRIVENKSRSLWLAGALFWLGSLLLALLIGTIVLAA